MLRLYGYWRSSSAYRVRIALGLKDLDYETVPVHLVREGGEQRAPGYRALNPQGLVPLLDHDGVIMSQSLAIIEYLEEVFPEPRLLPETTVDRARARSLAQLIACEIQPLNNLRVTAFLKTELKASDEDAARWYRHWIETGFDALERRLEEDSETGRFCHGDQPGLVDICLVPQVYNARRFSIPLEDYPLITAIEAECLSLGAFARAVPERQPDAE